MLHCEVKSALKTDSRRICPRSAANKARVPRQTRPAFRGKQSARSAANKRSRPFQDGLLRVAVRERSLADRERALELDARAGDDHIEAVEVGLGGGTGARKVTFRVAVDDVHIHGGGVDVLDDAGGPEVEIGVVGFG